MDDSEFNDIHNRLNDLIENERLRERTEKFAGKKILICGEGRRNKECGKECGDLLLKDKCGYHKRIEIRNFLKEKANMLGYVLDNEIGQNEPIIEREKLIIEKESIDVVLIFLDASGSHIELLDFAGDDNCKAEVIVCIRDEFFPYRDTDGVLTSKVKEHIMKKNCIPIAFNGTQNICELSYGILSDYFRNN